MIVLVLLMCAAGCSNQTEVQPDEECDPTASPRPGTRWATDALPSDQVHEVIGLNSWGNHDVICVIRDSEVIWRRSVDAPTVPIEGL